MCHRRLLLVDGLPAETVTLLADQLTPVNREMHRGILAISVNVDARLDPNLFMEDDSNPLGGRQCEVDRLGQIMIEVANTDASFDAGVRRVLPGRKTRR